MNEKVKILSIILSIIIIGVIIGQAILKSEHNNSKIDLENYTFKLDNELKYKVQTDLKYMTMLNDGGSHINEYYEIDLINNVVSKKRENYSANIGDTPSMNTKIIYTKKIQENISKEIKYIMQNLINKNDINDSKNYHSFSIKTNSIDKIIYNKESINTIKELLKKIDNS